MTRKTSIQAANRGCGKSIGQTDALGLVQFWERFCSRSVDGLVVFFLPVRSGLVSWLLVELVRMRVCGVEKRMQG
jgi:hypothetical protein